MLLIGDFSRAVAIGGDTYVWFIYCHGLQVSYDVNEFDRALEPHFSCATDLYYFMLLVRGFQLSLARGNGESIRQAIRRMRLWVVLTASSKDRHK